ncbi:hypothetical protein BDZ89DRAFT_1113747 [Hymenopellis radicata]|nr:hypothetical protein BDZ89DRAFT_1113747 [Hymenopellis radicata]
MFLSLIYTTIFTSFAFAQQYAGRRVAVPELPAVTGAELAYFNIKNNNGGNVTMLNYFSFPNKKRQDTTKVQRAVLYIHGANGNSQGYFSAMYQALNKATQLNPDVNQESVALMAPYFTSTKNNIERSDIVTWNDVSWYIGANSIYPQGHNVSSYDALDQILQYFNDISIYPNMKEIVVAGHSMGAQMVQRYAAVGKDLFLHVPVVYWTANPSSFVWLNSQRPLTTDSCPTYNDWHHGLENYNMDYERTFVRTLGSLGVRLRYGSRHIAYARGLNDFGDYKDGCAPDTTGANRGARMYNFLDAFPADSGDTVDFIAGIGHNTGQMAASESGLNRLFLDNFYGNGTRHADIGERGPPTRPGKRRLEEFD